MELSFFPQDWVSDPLCTGENSDTPPIHCVQHVLHSNDMSIQLPAGQQCEPVQMAEIVQQEYILVRGAWLYPSVNVTNTVHLSKHQSYCLQRQNRGRKDKPSELRLITDVHDKWIANTTTPQYAHIIPWCQWTQSLRSCILFRLCSFSSL